MEAERTAGEAFSPLGPGEEGRGSGRPGLEQHPPPCPLELSPPFLRHSAGSPCGVGVGSEHGGETLGIAVSLWPRACARACPCGRPHHPLPTVPLLSTPSACTCATSGCGPRAGTRSQGGISSEKRCFPECPHLALSSPGTLGEPRDSGLLGADSAFLGSQKGTAPSPLSYFPQMIGNRRSDEPTKTKKGLSIFLDAARWNRGESQGEVAGPRPP